MQIGKRIYFDKATGNILVDTGERQGFVVPITIEQDIAAYTALSERNPDTFDVIELDYGDYASDFAACNGYRVDPTTKELEFSYPGPNEPPDEQPVLYRQPLSTEVDELKQRQDASEYAILTLMDITLMGGM